MTLLGFIWTAIPCLLVGLCVCWWTRPRIAIRKREPARASGKLTVQYRGPLDFAGTELSDDIVVHRTEAR